MTRRCVLRGGMPCTSTRHACPGGMHTHGRDTSTCHVTCLVDGYDVATCGDIDTHVIDIDTHVIDMDTHGYTCHRHRYTCHRHGYTHRHLSTSTRLVNLSSTSFVDGYCSTVQGLLYWFEVDLGFTRAFIYSNLFVCSRQLVVHIDETRVSRRHACHACGGVRHESWTCAT